MSMAETQLELLPEQLDVYIRSLRDTLREYGAEQIMEIEKGVLRVKPDTFSCDAYLFFSGDADTINAYRGEYMSSYSWASMTEGILSWRTINAYRGEYMSSYSWASMTEGILSWRIHQT